MASWPLPVFFFFFNDTATTEIYTLSLHDALPIYQQDRRIRDAVGRRGNQVGRFDGLSMHRLPLDVEVRSEEHTSELQSPCNLVCRLLLEKKKKKKNSSPLIGIPPIASAFPYPSVT